jgi:hypothetical protein
VFAITGSLFQVQKGAPPYSHGPPILMALCDALTAKTFDDQQSAKGTCRSSDRRLMSAGGGTARGGPRRGRRHIDIAIAFLAVPGKCHLAAVRRKRWLPLVPHVGVIGVICMTGPGIEEFLSARRSIHSGRQDVLFNQRAAFQQWLGHYVAATEDQQVESSFSS